jgi:uncharacterized BrkB/YihY/UPF0761 family membrane protein
MNFDIILSITTMVMLLILLVLLIWIRGALMVDVKKINKRIKEIEDRVKGIEENK